jgi:hypothetical protein
MAAQTGVSRVADLRAGVGPPPARPPDLSGADVRAAWWHHAARASVPIERASDHFHAPPAPTMPRSAATTVDGYPAELPPDHRAVVRHVP